ncbi:MAG: LysR family transcriptional regulator [Rhizomicrobium sp.]
MTMRLKALQYLTAIVEVESFAKAAAGLGVNSSTLTRCIDALEDELGLTLLERGHAGVRLTSGGAKVMVEVRRMLADLNAVREAARCNGAGKEGEFRLGVRMPPVGDPLEALLAKWRNHHPGVSLTLYEMPDHDLYIAVESRRLDAALVADMVRGPISRQSRYSASDCSPLCRMIIHCVNAKASIGILCAARRSLVQDWDGSHATREFYASLLGIGIPFRSHSVSEQSLLALVGAGFGVTLVTQSQTQTSVPGVTFKPIVEANACVQIELAWAPESEGAVVGRFVSFMRDQARSR